MNKKTLFIILLIILIILAVVIALYIIEATVTGNATKKEVVENNISVDVFFCPREGCLEIIMPFVKTSKEIKCAFYDLDLPTLIEELKAKGADVVIEDSTFSGDFNTGYSKALMHNKFCIFDSKIVWTGSMNPTERDNYFNNNNIIIVHSLKIAKNYLDEFNELKNNIYGKGDGVEYPIVLSDNLVVENYFCPEDNCKLHVINALKTAEKSVIFLTYSFTDRDIGNLLYNKNIEGKLVRGIYEKKQISEYSTYEDLKDYTKIDTNPYNLHHKFFVIDNKTLIAGSYNPSRNANEYNDENVIIIHDEAIARRYADEFEYVWNIDYETMPDKPSDDIIISGINYNPEGKDEGNEFVELLNKGDKEIDLSYYFLSDNNTNSRLNGTIQAGKTLKAYPSFALKNKEGILILKKNLVPIDYIIWDEKKEPFAKEGDAMRRKELDSVAASAWSAVKP
ncbi:MAG: phospholipase D-like domain-containing protein [archaeon]